MSKILQYKIYNDISTMKKYLIFLCNNFRVVEFSQYFYFTFLLGFCRKIFAVKDVERVRLQQFDGSTILGSWQEFVLHRS